VAALAFFQHRCFLHCRVPRVKLSDGSVVLVSVPWSRSSSGFTLLFEAYCIALIQSEMPVSEVADVDLSEISQRGIDETSSKKGHKYVTIFVDMEQRRVIDVQTGKDSKTITNFVEYLESKGGDRNQIENVCIDMSPAFISGASAMLPNSKITFDKFHIVQHLNKALDIVRRDERKGKIYIIHLKRHRSIIFLVERL